MPVLSFFFAYGAIVAAVLVHTQYKHLELQCVGFCRIECRPRLVQPFRRSCITHACMCPTALAFSVLSVALIVTRFLQISKFPNGQREDQPSCFSYHDNGRLEPRRKSGGLDIIVWRVEYTVTLPSRLQAGSYARRASTLQTTRPWWQQRPNTSCLNSSDQ